MRAVLIAAMLLPIRVLAETTTVPASQTIGYQGRLMKSDGTATHGSKKIIFTLYDKDGVSRWSEEQSVALSNGFYAVFLGSATPFPPGLFDGSDRWLGVKIEGDTNELSPRHRIASVATAMTALQVPNGSVTTEKIGEGAVTNAKQSFGTPTSAGDVATKGYVDEHALSCYVLYVSSEGTIILSRGNVSGGGVHAAKITTGEYRIYDSRIVDGSFIVPLNPKAGAVFCHSAPRAYGAKYLNVSIASSAKILDSGVTSIGPAVDSEFTAIVCP